LNDNGDDIANNIHIDPTAFPFLQRAAKLSSAAYTGCLGTAFDVTITKQIYNGITDTQVSIKSKNHKEYLIKQLRATLDIPQRRRRSLSL
jgi:hypothetical protein